MDRRSLPCIDLLFFFFFFLLSTLLQQSGHFLYLYFFFFFFMLSTLLQQSGHFLYLLQADSVRKLARHLMILITFCSLKRMKTCTTLSRRLLMSTLLETIHAMTRHTFPTFTKMIIVIFRVEFSITFVTVIRAIKKHTK